MEFISEAIQSYAEAHTSEEAAHLNELDRETHLNVLMPRMLSGHLQGRVLSMLSHMIKPKTILEIGTYTGYSALCMLEGLKEGGKLITIDKNEELEDMVRRHLEKNKVANQVEYLIGNAIGLIPELPGPFDLVFIDADKANYSNYFDLVIDKVPSGGYIIADNVLWSGKVVEEVKKKDKETKAILDFNKKVHQDNRVENVLFPIRDGLMVLRKI